jgi:hypothetical protein
MTPWWAHWYVMIPAVLALWGLGIALGVTIQRRPYKPPKKPPKPRVYVGPCEPGWCEWSSYDNRSPCVGIGCQKARYFRQ